ncbi:MAG: hypothetical protein VKK63_12125 [Synechococcus sp.]|nr:hypothetical protein [Synechococcus sp.]
MIYDIDQSYGVSAHNGKARHGYSDKSPERSPYELLGWAILEQAVDDLVLFCRFGIITQEGNCLPWPTTVKRRLKWTKTGPKYSWDRIPRNIATCKGPNDHKELRAWLLSEEAIGFCDLIGCRIPPAEIFWKTLKNHGDLK